jgi:hypothetical protein
LNYFHYFDSQTCGIYFIDKYYKNEICNLSNDNKLQWIVEFLSKHNERSSYDCDIFKYLVTIWNFDLQQIEDKYFDDYTADRTSHCLQIFWNSDSNNIKFLLDYGYKFQLEIDYVIEALIRDNNLPILQQVMNEILVCKVVNQLTVKNYKMALSLFDKLELQGNIATFHIFGQIKKIKIVWLKKLAIIIRFLSH